MECALAIYWTIVSLLSLSSTEWFEYPSLFDSLLLVLISVALGRDPAGYWPPGLSSDPRSELQQAVW